MQHNPSKISMTESPAMKFLPITCNPAAFMAFRAAVARIDGPDALLDAHVAISAKYQDEARKEILKRVWAIGTEVQARVHGGQAQAIFAHLHEVLFEEKGLLVAGISNMQVRHVCLPTAVESFHASPSIAALIYKLVADRLGCQSWGNGVLSVGMIVTIVLRSVAMMIDPASHGGIVTVNELKSRVVAANIEWSDQYLSPLSNKDWITASMQEMLHTMSVMRKYDSVASVLEMEIVLHPDQIHLIRDLSLVLARIGNKNAGPLLSLYLSHNPDDAQIESLKDLAETLNAR